MAKASTHRRKVRPPPRPTIHPGELLAAEYLGPLGLSVPALAAALHAPVGRISAIVKGKRAVSADTALRLARYFGVGAEFWLTLQSSYDLSQAVNESGAEIDRQIEPRPR